jgi:dipeptidyl aminopeptidase/acylaminoacyl peptidase
MRRVRALALAFLLAAPALGAGRPLTIDDLLAVKAVSDPQVSPDGSQVVYVVSEINRETNKTNSDLWTVPVAGGEPKRLTTAPGADSHPRWSPDGTQIAFVSDRGGSSQVWLLPVAGGEAGQLTKLPIDVAGPIWSPKGDTIAFAAEVYPGSSPEQSAAKDKEKADAKSKARIYDHLMIRHWNAWDEGKRSHMFVADAKTGQAKDLTPDLEVNTPPAPFGGSNDYAFSPDGQELAFTVEPRQDTAWSTNTDIWTVPISSGAMKNVTEANLAADAQPAYSPDGKMLAYVAQARPGFEADMWVLHVMDRRTGKKFGLPTEDLGPVLSFVWESAKEPLSGMLLTVTDARGTERVSRVAFTILEGKGKVGSAAMIDVLTSIRRGVCTSPQVVKDPLSIVYVNSLAYRPSELLKYTPDLGKIVSREPIPQLTHHNDALIAELDLAKPEPFTFEGAEGDDVGAFLIRPPAFDPEKKYPVVLLIHGGPQSAWHDEWHARWNYQMFAAPGYAVLAINPRGSTGYGQKFTDQISRDWTGRVYEDLIKGLNHSLRTYRFLDADRVAAAGGSYGGFMVNWIAGHSNRFKALVSHAGVFDLTSMYYTTEELWFPEWEFGGTPWSKPKLYLEQTPSAFVQNFKTPTLVIHGALDFRVPDAQGLGMFTALQRQAVPSRYVFFPDEGHWIAKPSNRIVWWREVHDWLKKYLKP